MTTTSKQLIFRGESIRARGPRGEIDISSWFSRNGDLQRQGRKTDGTRDDFGVPMIASRFSGTETSAAVTIPAEWTELSSKIVFLPRLGSEMPRFLYQ